jgi:hypothetical protein
MHGLAARHGAMYKHARVIPERTHPKRSTFRTSTNVQMDYDLLRITAIDLTPDLNPDLIPALNADLSPNRVHKNDLNSDLNPALNSDLIPTRVRADGL